MPLREGSPLTVMYASLHGSTRKLAPLIAYFHETNTEAWISFYRRAMVVLCGALIVITVA